VLTVRDASSHAIYALELQLIRTGWRRKAKSWIGFPK
jgi:hypothetical protein